MTPFLEYARRRKQNGREFRKRVVARCAHIIFLAGLTVLAALFFLTLRKDYYSFEPATTGHYWNALYNGSGSIVDHQGDNTIYVWRGRDTHLYLSVNTRAAEAAGDAGAQAHVKNLLRYAGEWSSDPDVDAASLRQLTGQNFQSDGNAWQTWAIDHLKEVKGGETIYRQLITMQSKAAQTMPYAAALQPGEYNYRDPLYVESRWQEIYQDEVKEFWWKPWHLIELAVPLMYLVSVIPLSLRFARKRRKQNIAIASAVRDPGGRKDNYPPADDQLLRKPIP